MFYKIGICDDDSYFLDTLNKALQRYEQLYPLSFEIYTYLSGEELLKSYHNQHLNLLLLDMEMHGLNGLDIARKLRKANDEISIIYTTVHENYALQAFQVAADSYLIKPISDKVLFSTLDRVFHKLTLQTNFQSLQDLYFPLNLKDKIVQLPYTELLYISKARNLLTFYTSSNHYSIYMNIQDVLNKLDSSIFVRINRGQIVNWTKITSIDNATAYIGHIELPISRSHYSQLNKRFHQELEQLLRVQRADCFI